MADLLQRKKTHFVLWRPQSDNPAPALVIGEFDPAVSDGMMNRREIPLTRSGQHPDLWEIPASACQLQDGKVYHYWFRLTDSNPYKRWHPKDICCADPAAYTVDYRLKSTCFPTEFCSDDKDPASVIKYQGGELVAADPDGTVFKVATDPETMRRLAPNNRAVIYELPVAWARLGTSGGVETDIGSFVDVLALIRKSIAPVNFSGVAALEVGQSHLEQLGANVLELLPPSDSCYQREWGYGTSNFFAPDFDLGMPQGAAVPAAGKGLADVVSALHTKGICFFPDMVMAFAKNYPYQNINYLDFNVQCGTNDPGQYLPDGRSRDGFGADLNYQTTSYDPVHGSRSQLYPARSLMMAQLSHWMSTFQIDGVRIDSVENISSWDFMKDFRDFAREEWRAKAIGLGLSASEYEPRFQVIGEELSVPKGLLDQDNRRLDALWNEDFKRLIRQAVLGKSGGGLSFEETVRRIVDCRQLKFSDGAEAINYICSHDVGGFGNERMFNYLVNNGITETDRRIKLAFACLLTAVGTPMIFAGEEFADQHDLDVIQKKQADPVNWSRKEDPWRREVFDYVARLVRLRTSHDALAVNDVKFIHADFDGKRVMAWQRGSDKNPVLVVANFSDYATPAGAAAEYQVQNWPKLPSGKKWCEVTQNRQVPANWAGREPVYPWEAKVYVAA